MRDSIQELEKIDREKIIYSIFTYTLKSFKRKSMKDFEYLDNEIEPPTWVIVLAFIILIGINVGTVMYVNNTGRAYGRRYRFR